MMSDSVSVAASSTGTSGTVTVEVDFTGGYPLWLGAADCLK